MTDPVPSKELASLLACAKETRLTNASYAWNHIKLLADEIDRLQHKLDTCGLQCSATLKSLVAENDRLRTTLTGISTCSTCEACRGAATRALGGEAPPVRKPDKFDLAFEIMRQLEAEDMETMQSCQFGYVMRVTRERAAQPPGDG